MIVRDPSQYFNDQAPFALSSGPESLDWDSLVDLEPRLATLYQQAKKIRGDWRMYESLKRELQKLVGYRAVVPELRSDSAYELAHREIFRGLA